DQAMCAAAEAVAAARRTGHSFPVIYALTFAATPVALWAGAVDEARRQVDLLAAHAGGNQRAEQCVICFTRALKLRDGGEAEALVAAVIEAQFDPATVPMFADLPADAQIPVPLPGAD